MTLKELIDKNVTLVGYTKAFQIRETTYQMCAQCNIIVFNYNSKEYIMKVYENPDDGYRSYLGDVEFVDNNDHDYKHCQLVTLPPANVTFSHKEGKSYNTYYFNDEFNHHWISFGTNDTDDYYPSYYFNEPEVDLKSWREAKLNDILQNN